MECVVKVVRGSPLTPKDQECIFCKNKEAIAVFSVTKEIKYDGVLLSCFGICKEHLDRLNALLSGEFNIDDIFLEKYRVQRSQKIQLRGFMSRHAKIKRLSSGNSKNKK